RSGARVRDPGVGRVALRVSDRHPGAAQRALERPREVAVRGEPQRPPLGVPEAYPRHHRRLPAWWLLSPADVLSLHPADLGLVHARFRRIGRNKSKIGGVVMPGSVVTPGSVAAA